MRDESFRTSWPDTRLTTASDETRQTSSESRFSAASRSRRSSAWSAHFPLLPAAVEDHDTARPASGDEARKRVHELTCVRERPGVEKVVAVEQVERRIRHHAASRWRAAS